MMLLWPSRMAGSCPAVERTPLLRRLYGRAVAEVFIGMPLTSFGGCGLLWSGARARARRKKKQQLAVVVVEGRHRALESFRRWRPFRNFGSREHPTLNSNDYRLLASSRTQRVQCCSLPRTIQHLNFTHIYMLS